MIGWGQGLDSRVRFAEWRRYCLKKRARLQTCDFTMISSNCVGMIYRDLGLQYRTPTVNLAISMRDMVKLAQDLRGYMAQELVELSPLEDAIPRALLGDIPINFVHYASFEEGKRKWDERKQRLHWDNLFVMGTEREDCDYEALQRFDRLPYPHKAVLTRVEYLEFSSAYHIPGFEGQGELGAVTNFKPQFFLRRYMDDFDYISFLNGGKGEA